MRCLRRPGLVFVRPCSGLCLPTLRPHALKARLCKAGRLGRGRHLRHAVGTVEALRGRGQGGAFVLHLLGVRARVARGLEAALLA